MKNKTEVPQTPTTETSPRDEQQSKNKVSKDLVFWGGFEFIDAILAVSTTLASLSISVSNSGFNQPKYGQNSPSLSYFPYSPIYENEFIYIMVG